MVRLTLEEAEDLAYKKLGPKFSRIDKGLNNWVFKNKNRLLTITRHERVKD